MAKTTFRLKATDPEIELPQVFTNLGSLQKSWDKILPAPTFLAMLLLTAGVAGTLSTQAVSGPPGNASSSKPSPNLREIIGRFDADYWNVVDIETLTSSQQIALSPDGNWLALVRDKILYVIESGSGKIQDKRPLSLSSATIHWNGNDNLSINDGVELSLRVRKQYIKVVGADGDTVSFNGVTSAHVGYPFEQRNGWGAHRSRDDLVSLAGLSSGDHRLVLAPSFSQRNIIDVTLPLPNDETVVQGKLRRESNWASTNFHFTAQSAVVENESIVTVRIQNRTGKPMAVSDYDLRLEVSAPNVSSYWGLSPVWRKELNRKARKVTVADGEVGEITLSWQDFLRSGLWYDEKHYPVIKNGPAIPPSPPRQIGVRVWVRNAATLPINMIHPALAIPNDMTANQPPVAQKVRDDDATIRDYVMLQLQRYIIRQGKIETRRIRMAMDVVASEGVRIPEVRKILLDELKKSHANRNGLVQRKQILSVTGRILAQDAQSRWAHEYAKRPGAFPQQRAIPPETAVYAKSPYLEDIMELGMKATRSDIAYYVMAVRNAHHPQAISFLLDVVNNPGAGGPFDNRPATGKWTDNIGGGWNAAKLYAAAGLAELGRPEGMQWLIQQTRPRDYQYEIGEMSVQVLRDLTRSQRDLGFNGWNAWWEQNQNTFSPDPASSIGNVVDPLLH